MKNLFNSKCQLAAFVHFKRAPYVQTLGNERAPIVEKIIISETEEQ